MDENYAEHPNDPEIVGSGINQPVSERLADQNEVLGEEALKLAGLKEEISAASIADKIFNPNVWSKKREWKNLKDNPEKQALLKEQAEKYLPQIHAEALDYVAAYNSYIETREILVEGLGIEAGTEPMSIEQYMNSVDHVDGKRQESRRVVRWYELNSSLPTDENERHDYFIRRGQLDAAAHILTPQLPVETVKHAATWDIKKNQEYDKPVIFKQYVSKLPSGNTVTPGGRFPRLELAVSEDEIMNPNFSPDKPYAIAIEVDTYHWRSYGANEKDVKMRYIPVTEGLNELAGVIGDSLDGTVDVLDSVTNAAGAQIDVPTHNIDFKIRLVERSSIGNDSHAQAAEKAA